MSAEERAHLLANDLLARGMVPILTHEARAVIASAIREAQASARNEALEEAAVLADAHSDACQDNASFWETHQKADRRAIFNGMADEAQDIASAIRNLKTKD